MPARDVPDDDEQQIADLIRGARRLQAQITTTGVTGGKDAFTVAATPATDYPLTCIPVQGTCEVCLNGDELEEDTDYTVDYDTGSATAGVLSVSAGLSSGDLLLARYLRTDWLVARSLPTEGVVPVDFGMPVDSNTGGSTSIVSGSFTPPANTLLLVFAEWNQPSATTTTGISDTIGGLTWTEITTGWHSQTVSGSTRYSKASVFWAVTGSSPPSGTITLTSSASVAMSFRAITVPDANTASPIGNHNTTSVQASFALPSPITCAATASGAALVIAFMGQGAITAGPSTVSDDSAFTNLFTYNGGGGPVHSVLDVSYSRSSHSSTWAVTGTASQFDYYDAIVLEING